MLSVQHDMCDFRLQLHFAHKLRNSNAFPHG
jgi:hypothetical protein